MQDDKILVAGALDGDQEAFAQLFERYKRYVYTIAYKITLNVEDAFDVTQNVFVILMEKLNGYKGSGPFRAWLATVTSHETINYMRRTKHNKETTVESSVWEVIQNRGEQQKQNDPRRSLEIKESIERVEAAMKELSPQQRAILTLRLKEDMGPKEIGEHLDIPAQQVRTQMHRALAKIREILHLGESSKSGSEFA